MAQILTANELNKIAQGSGYKGGSFSSVGLPTTLNSTNTTPTPPINLTPKPDNTNYAGMINSAAQQSLTYTTPSGAEVDTQGNLVSEPKPTPQSSNSILDYIKSYTSIQPPNATQTYNEGLANDQQLAQTKADLNAKKAITAEAQGRLNNISAQLQALNTEAQYVPVQVQQDSQGRGITAGGAAPIQADKLRAIALRALPLQAQGALIQAEVASAQGQEKLAQDLYTQAQDHFDKMFTLQMQDAQNQYEFKTNLINKVYEFADKQEQRQLAQIKDQADRDYKAQQDKLAYEREANLIRLRKETPQPTPTPTPDGNPPDPINDPNLKLTTAQKSDLVDIQTLEDQLNKLQGYAADGKLEGIGSLGAGTVKQGLYTVAGIGSQEGADVRVLIGNLKGQIAKLRGGTSFTANEEKLLNSYVPGINESTESVMAKVRGLQDFLVSKKNAIIKLGGGTTTNNNDPLGIL